MEGAREGTFLLPLRFLSALSTDPGPPSAACARDPPFCSPSLLGRPSPPSPLNSALLDPLQVGGPRAWSGGGREDTEGRDGVRAEDARGVGPGGGPRAHLPPPPRCPGRRPRSRARPRSPLAPPAHPPRRRPRPPAAASPAPGSSLPRPAVPGAAGVPGGGQTSSPAARNLFLNWGFVWRFAGARGGRAARPPRLSASRSGSRGSHRARSPLPCPARLPAEEPAGARQFLPEEGERDCVTQVT